MHLQSENLFKKFLYSRVALTLGLFFVFFLIYAVSGMAQKRSDTARNKVLAETQLAKLESENQKLKGNIENLNTEEGKETAIREKFRVVKEGEGLVVIVDAPTVEPAPETNRFTAFFKKLFGRGKKE